MEAEKVREFDFTERHFSTICKLVREHTGINLTDGKRDMVYSRLSRRLRKLGIDGFSEYCTLLENPANGELDSFINAVTTNLTSFFREPHHFEYLAQTVLPALMKARARERRLRLWSAGCSTGEEPYSIAMVLREVFAGQSGWDVRLLATDIDTDVLDTARRGVYPLERLEGISADRRKRFLRRGTGEQAGFATMADEVRNLITFNRLNLMGEWPFKGPFDVIFCRNVVIYFDKPTQRVLFDRYANALQPDGHLFLGHSETLYRVSERFELLGRTTYRKIA